MDVLNLERAKPALPFAEAAAARLLPVDVVDSRVDHVWPSVQSRLGLEDRCPTADRGNLDGILAGWSCVCSCRSRARGRTTRKGFAKGKRL